MANTLELANTGKRDFLIALEKKYQAIWEEEKAFEVDPPTQEETAGMSIAEIHEKYPKWMGNYPYPYMNGSLHLGHAFTISKIEFGAGYQRMLGKRALFPHGFHVTGMPIKAASDKIIREIELFGPDFERYEPESEDSAVTAEEKSSAPVVPNPSAAVDKAKKGKIAAKATGLKYQFQIMESIGVPKAEIKRFADPLHWLTYFPPIAIADNKAFGSRVDWRRAFLTTDANPYYDSFVRWQFNKLHKQGRIKFGERYTIYSPKDGQPCMDHDRQDGEGFGPQEYTAVKMEVLDLSAAAKEALEGKLAGRKLFLVAATLRPETMYGQTNCFVGTAIKYLVFAVNDHEAHLCTNRAARNMAFQGALTSRGEVPQLAEVEGSKLVGTRIKAPFSVHPEVYVLPMENVLATKGTGVVTSVPSDSPDDFAALTDLRKKPAFYGIEPSWAALDPVPVINTPTYGDLTAPALVTSLKIQSQKDQKQLAEAKEIAYKEGFYNGTMLVGQWKGESVQDAKPKVRAEMLAAGLAFPYAEPEGLVVSRSMDECVVALMDQWYLDYGEKEWRAQTEKALAKMHAYNTETRNGFEATLAWLNQWACARTYGLGSKVPWDPQFLIESLSDSTVYMAYYTVSHYLHQDMEGKIPGPLGIKPSQMSDELWEHILCGGPLPVPCPISDSALAVLKHSYNYFYPFEIRSSGKDLIPNHLTFSLYTHVALFPEAMWPRSMRANGHLMLNGKKMSKSTGNSLTMRESVRKYGADATRVTLADAGDGVEDANFDELSASAVVVRIWTLVGWCEEMMKDAHKLRQGPKNSYHDRVFEAEIIDLINITQGHYDATNYKDALKYGFFELQSARDWYREVCSLPEVGGMHVDLVRYWMRAAALLSAPVAPHWAEHVWRSVLQEKGSVQSARWPRPPATTPEEVEERKGLVEAGLYMRGVVRMLREAEGALVKRLNKSKGKGNAGGFDPKKAKSVRLYVATTFPDWQNACVRVVKASWDGQKEKVDDVAVREGLTKEGLMKDKRVMPFVQAFKKRIAEFGAETAFRRTLPFSEREVLMEIRPYIVKTLGLVDADVISVEEARSASKDLGYNESIVDGAEPGTPAVEYRNV